MRSLKELYQILLDNFDCNHLGICIKIVLLEAMDEISYEEMQMLQYNFKSRIPTIFSRFYWNRSFNKFGNRESDYWWKFDIRGNAQRKKFLQHIIKKL